MPSPKKEGDPKKQSSTAVVAVGTTRNFFVDDYPKTLFPLSTNRVLVDQGEQEIVDYINRCLNETEKAFAFSSQKRVYASKPGEYLRRTVKLDVVAEYYIYDVIFRNRKLFRKPHVQNRTHYGYRFEEGSPILATNAYKGFKGGIAAYSKQYRYSRGLDVATYFNSMYHHDIVNWFHELGATDEDAEGLGRVLREIAAGRSIDCLPQGLYPTKMIGNDFLRFIDNYHDLKSEQLIRFMDDIYLFSNDEQAIIDDFQTIQRLLGDKGLSVNPRKTRINDSELASIDKDIDQVKTRLLRRRRIMIMQYDSDGEEVVKQSLIRMPLNRAEMKYIDGILEKRDIEEEDAELLLTIMRGHAHRVERRLPYIIETYPHLAKNLHAFCSDIEDKEVVAEMILAYAKEHDRLSENQLFWFCATLADQLMSTTKASALISVLFNHRSASQVTKAKILEIPDIRFGLQELRDEILSNGHSDWLGWASAVGSRALKPASRNHKLTYWAKSSNMNHLVATILLKA